MNDKVILIILFIFLVLAIAFGIMLPKLAGWWL